LSPLAFAPVINPKIGYDPLNDLTNVAYLAGCCLPWCEHSESAALPTRTTPLLNSISGWQG